VDVLVQQLFHDFKKEPIVLKYSGDFEISKVKYDYVPIGLSCSIPSGGVVDAYTFAYQIVASQDFMSDLLKYIKVLNPSYDERVEFYIEEDRVKYTHLNYCNITEKQTLDINQTIFDLLVASIEATQSLMHNYAEFETIVSKYIKTRLLEFEL
jgi:hypothetical protein